MLAAVFSGRYENNMDYNNGGNVYIGYPPPLMIPLMDWLTTNQDASPDEQAPTLNIPPSHEDVWDGALSVSIGLESLFSRPPAAKMFNSVPKKCK